MMWYEMDSFSHSLLHTLAEALAALRPHGAASIALCDAHGALVEHARAGQRTALAHLPALSPHRGSLTGTYPAGHTGNSHYIANGVERALGSGWYVLHVALQPGRLSGGSSQPLGLVRLVLAEEPAPALIRAVEAMAAHAAIALEQSALHQELQHSFNGLFMVYEAGRLLNLCHTAEDVYAHVIGLLTGPLHVRHCAVLLLEDDTLVPATHAGLDPQRIAAFRPPLARTFAARVLEAGAAAQFEDAVNLEDILLPTLDAGMEPASVLSAPLSTRAGTLGFLEVYRATTEPFTDDEIFVVSVLAVEMAAALENARLYEELSEREERLTQYAARLVTSQEEERRRISRDIHDGLGQMIVSAFQYLQAHDYSLESSHPREALQRGLEVLQECIAETRRVMSDLRPSTLDDFGLIVALQQQLDRAAQEAGWEADFQVDGSFTRLAPTVETTVFRVVQEALNNARKHAATTRVRVTLSRGENEVVITVQDWGRGFAVDGVAARSGEASARGQHLGLMGMRERVSLLGGSVTITSIPGTGTTVRIVLPAQ